MPCRSNPARKSYPSRIRLDVVVVVLELLGVPDLPRLRSATVDEVAGLLLAAGAGRRYGMPKALVVHGPELLVERGVRVLRDAGLAPVVVVLGAAADDVRAAADLAGTQVVVNADWASGMGISLRSGLSVLEQAAIGAHPLHAVVILLVDTPGITAGAVRRIAAYATSDALVAATYGGQQGHPVLIGRRHWAGVAESATGDRGARAYLREHAQDLRLVPCDDIADGTDMDTPPV